MQVIFKSKEHKARCKEYLNRMQCADCYHKAAAFLLALNDTCSAHIHDIFDFEADAIKPECLGAAWQTGTSAKVCRLCFNLWNGFAFDGETDEPSIDYTPENLFCCQDVIYLLEAVKIRYSIYSDAETERRDYAEEIANSAKDGASDD